MHKPQLQVREFHKAYSYPTAPAVPKLRTPLLRASLILEEALETIEALVGTSEMKSLVRGALYKYADCENKDPNLIEAVDGCMDLLFVTYGTCEDIGIDGEPFFDEVHRSNMAKVGGERRADGKQLKPPGWTPPAIARLLALAADRATSGVDICEACTCRVEHCVCYGRPV